MADGDAPNATSGGRLSDTPRSKARGSYADPRIPEPVLLRHSGREKGGVLYLDATTLRDALRKAGIPVDTPVDRLQVLRRTMGGRPHIAQVLLEIRVRRGTAP